VNPSATASVHAGSSAARAHSPRAAAEGQAAGPFANLLGDADAAARSAPAEQSAREASEARESRHDASESKSSADPALGVLLALGLEPLPAPPPLVASVGLLGAATSDLDASALDSMTNEAGELALDLDADAAHGRGARAGGALAAAVAAALAEQSAALSQADAADASDADTLKLANAMPAASGASSTASAQARTLAASAAAAQHTTEVQRQARGAASAATSAAAAKLAAAATAESDAARADAAPDGLLDPLANLRAANAEAALGAPRPARAGADFSAPLPGSAAAPGSAPPGSSGTVSIPAESPGFEDLAKAIDARTDSRSGSVTPALQGASGAERGDLTSTQFAHALRDPATALSSLHPTLPARLDPHAPGFTGVVAQQVAWQAETRIGRAEIRLEPEELGPMDITVELDGDEIRAEFTSRSAEVRSLLESQVPKLRELLAEQGFSLADAQVGQERAAYSDAQAQREGFGKPIATGDRAQEADTAAAAPVVATRMRLGLVDDYA
jgi:flagellar hook-length control protein FliK